MHSAKWFAHLGWVAAVLLASGCAATDGGHEMQTTTVQTASSAKFVHCVFFTCKPETPAGEIESLLADADKLLARIPSVRKIDCGRRDARMTRDVNDREYTVGLVVYFEDKAGHDLYDGHALHTEYVEKHKAHWAGVRVCDFLAE